MTSTGWFSGSFQRVFSLLRRAGKGRDQALPSVPTKLRGTRRLEVVAVESPLIAAIEINNYLASYAKSVTSQDGEDGVLAEVFGKLGISKGWCVEFGAWDGKLHSNTWTLVHNHEWSAVYVEPHRAAFDVLTSRSANRSDIHCFNEFVNVEGQGSLQEILARTPIPVDFDLLVIDIDGNDYFIWRAFEAYRPKVVMIEFNPFMQADISFFVWNDEQVKASASLTAVCELAKTKSYELICVIGGNAVFVRRELYERFDVADNRPVAIFRPRLETKMFQGYDGTLFLAGNRKLIWRHQLNRSGVLDHVEVADEDIQVLPKGLRVFRPRMSFKNDFLDRCAGQIESARVPSNRLLAHKAKVTSENGEDGILRQILDRIGTRKKFCVDVGAYDGHGFSNSWSLINEHGWSAVLIEKDAEAFKALEERYRDNPRVKAVRAEVTTGGEGGLERLLKFNDVPRELDFLCIDVEGNDYNLWDSLTSFRPAVVMVDFNPTISNDVIFVQEDSLEVNHGASLRAFVELARLKEYELAAVTTWNAIFVRRDVFPKLDIGNNHIDQMYYPVFETRVFQSIDSYLSVVGCDRLIRHDYVFDPDFLQPLPPDVRAMPFVTGNLGELKSTFHDRAMTNNEGADG